MDVVFLVDVTRSADITHDVITPFVRLAVEGLPTKHEQVRIAIVSYAQDIYVHNYLDGYQVGLYRPIGYERVYLTLYKVADTPFHIQGNDIYGVLWSLLFLITHVNTPLYDTGNTLAVMGGWDFLFLSTCFISIVCDFIK